MSSSSSSNNSDVIIIGAGVSGLSAAAELGRAGIRVLILEARNQLGGRIFTRYDATHTPIELGAEFIHGRPPEILTLLHGAGLQPEEVAGEDWCFRNGQLCECDFFPRVDQLLEKLDDRRPDESFSAFLDRCDSDCADEETRRWALGYVRGFHAADPALISVHSLVKGMRADEKIEGERAFRIPQGYESLIKILQQRTAASSVSIRLETVVEQVNWRAGSVQVSARDGHGVAEFEVPRALVTVPLGVLQAGTVAFSPALPERKQRALNHLAMGHVLRITLRFRERFWDKLRAPKHGRETLSDLRFLFSQEARFPTWWTGLGRLPILTGWSPMLDSQELSGKGEGYVLGAALHTLSTILNVPESELEQMLESAAWHDWQTDPFTRGAYSYVKVGGDTAQTDLAAPMQETLFFAGEATDVSGYTGTVHGAIASGRRAAEEIVRSAG